MHPTTFDALRSAIGPAPWYWETFPAVPKEAGSSFEWRFHGREGPDAYLVTLGDRGDRERARLAVGTYTRVFLIPPRRLGLWYAHRGSTRLVCLDPERLEAFATTEIPENFRKTSAPHHFLGNPAATVDIPSLMSEGVHQKPFPADFWPVDELLVIADRPNVAPSEPACSILEIHPADGRVRAYPQKWFTRDSVDTGYQWITRVARDPRTGHLVGDGFRIDDFELADDGCGRVGIYSRPPDNELL